MAQYPTGKIRKRRAPRPLGRDALEELALAYAARFATSAAKLEAYLQRKLRERGWEGREDGAEPPDTRALVERFADKGYVDDESYARMRAGDLLRRGYGPRRIGQALHQAGIDEQLREDMTPGEAKRREAAIAMARKRRFGLFAAASRGEGEEARKRFEKQLAAMVRAGHDFATARTVLDAQGEGELDQWLAEAREEERDA